MNQSRIDRMKSMLRASLAPELLEIDDESHLHAGHAGARDGRGHFRLTVVAAQFSGLTRIQRHRLVFDSLGEMMQTDIHALSIQAFAPGEI